MSAGLSPQFWSLIISASVFMCTVSVCCCLFHFAVLEVKQRACWASTVPLSSIYDFWCVLITVAVKELKMDKAKHLNQVSFLSLLLLYFSLLLLFCLFAWDRVLLGSLAGLELMILLIQPSECRDYGHVPPYLPLILLYLSPDSTSCLPHEAVKVTCPLTVNGYLVDASA